MQLTPERRWRANRFPHSAAGRMIWRRTGPLHEAAMSGNLAMIRLLLERGADPNLRDPGYDATPRGWAEHHGMTGLRG